MLRTDRPIVTNMIDMHTHFRSSALVKTRTRVGITAFLVLVAWTVVHTIAADIHRQAVVLVWTPEVCLRASTAVSTACVRWQGSSVYKSFWLKVYDHGNVSLVSPANKSVTSENVRSVQTQYGVVTAGEFLHTLQPLAMRLQVSKHTMTNNILQPSTSLCVCV